MALKLSNNADGLLALAISDSDTSLTLEAGHGSRFPALGSGDWFPITVVRASDPTQLEIMRCTARTLDTLTVERAQEGTSALAFDPGDVVELRLTSGTLEENFPQVEGANAKNLRFSIDSVGGKPRLKFKSGDDEETLVPIGAGQTWQDVRTQRAIDTTYTNTTGRPILVAVSLQALGAPDAENHFDFFVDDVLVGSAILAPFGGAPAVGARMNIYAIVPAGSSYRVVRHKGDGDIIYWSELR